MHKGKPECINQKKKIKRSVKEVPLKIKGSKDQTLRVQVLNELSLFIDPGFFFMLCRKQKIKLVLMGAGTAGWVLRTAWPVELGRGCSDCALRTSQHKGAATQLIGEDKRQVFMRQAPSLSEMKDKNLSSYVLFYRWEVSEGKKNYQSF